MCSSWIFNFEFCRLLHDSAKYIHLWLLCELCDILLTWLKLENFVKVLMSVMFCFWKSFYLCIYFYWTRIILTLNIFILPVRQQTTIHTLCYCRATARVQDNISKKTVLLVATTFTFTYFVSIDKIVHLMIHYCVQQMMFFFQYFICLRIFGLKSTVNCLLLV